jgi:hypothetical protein
MEVGRETGSDDVCSELVADVGFSIVGVDGRWEIPIKHEREWELMMAGFEGMIVSLVSL